MRVSGELLEQFIGRLRDLRCAIREVLYGMTVYELELELRKERKALEDLLFLMLFGDVLGLPFFPPYFSLRILPYVLPRLQGWKRGLMREKDLTELAATEV